MTAAAPAPAGKVPGTPVADRPTILTCAVSGGIITGNPNQPRTRTDVVATAVDAVAAGASVLHIHARSVDGIVTQDPEDYLWIKEAILTEVDDVVLNFTTGAWVGLAPEKRRRSLEAQPHMASLNCGSLNFGAAGDVFVNSPSYIEDLSNEMNQRGIVREYECFDMGMVLTARKLCMTTEAAPGMMHLVLGVVGGVPPTVQVVTTFSSWVPDAVPWMVTAVGRNHFPMMAVGLALGGHVRTGLEDVVYAAPRVYAESNAQLVRRARSLSEGVGRGIATPAETREMLGITDSVGEAGGGASRAENA